MNLNFKNVVQRNFYCFKFYVSNLFFVFFIRCLNYKYQLFMKNNFNIKCPFCEAIIDLYDEDNVKDEFFDDSDSTEFDCPNCNSELEITTHTVYSFTAELNNEDDCLDFKNGICEHNGHCRFKEHIQDSNNYKCLRF